MSALLALIPGKDLFYGAVIVALLAAGGYEVHHLKAEGAAAEVKVVQAASAKAQAAAAKQIADLNSQHAASIAAIQEKQSADLKVAAAQSADLASRLRNYQANRGCPHPVLGGAAATPAPGAAGSSSVDEALAGVIAAAAHDHAIVVAERTERDGLTGK